MTVIKGPFFNMRVFDEMPYYKKLIWRVFGKKTTATTSGEIIGREGQFYMEAYQFRNVTFIYKCHEVKL